MDEEVCAVQQTPADPDREARRTLARHRRLAHLLLLLMAALTAAGHVWRLPPLLLAASTAGLVGGLADWFAVTALFRHPLGLPIPHTAIIPAQQARIGAAFGRFIAGHVFTEAELSAALGRLDVASILAGFLADAEARRPAAEALAGMLPRLLGAIEDGRARRLVVRLVPRLVGGPGGGRIVGRALRHLVEGGRHQEVFGFLLLQLKNLLAAREAALQQAIEERVREQGGRLVGWAVGASVAKRVIAQINTELERMEPDGSELRAAFDEWMRREIARIEEEPARAAEIGVALRRVVAHETVRAWLWDIWSRVRLALEQDAARPSGRTVAAVDATLANLGQILREDPRAGERLREAVRALAARLMPAGRGEIARFVEGVVNGWDTATLTARLELRVGKDLQYIRMNGTIVGALAGAAVALLAGFGAH
ncbi:MAG: DUF445 domain-containing protein [Rhodospirillales bacterium]|nr:DUF445 domain-containing protein [Rhodospirillales bacterium]